MASLTSRLGAQAGLWGGAVAALGLAAWIGWGAQGVHGQNASASKPSPANQAQPAKSKAPAPQGPVSPPARKYKELPVDAEQGSLAVRRAVSAILRGGTLTADQQAQLDKYYTAYAFPRWTQPANYRSIPEFRSQLRSDLRAARSGPIYGRLVNHTLGFMKQFLGPEFPPVVRFNAMLAIGELNTEEQLRTAGQVVTPLPEAQALLLKELWNPSQSDEVKLAALLGLIRHCSLGIADPQRRDKEVVEPLLGLARSPVQPGRSEQGHAWMRMLACDALGALRYPGANGAVALTLADLVKQEDTPILVRVAAAKALGNLDYQVAAGLKPLSLGVPLAKMARDCCAAERDRPAPQPAVGPAGPMGVMGPMAGMMPPRGSGAYSPEYMGAMGPVMTPEEAEHVQQLRRRLKTQLLAVLDGLGNPNPKRPAGVGALAVEKPEGQFFNEVIQAIQELTNKALDDKDIPLDKLLKRVEETIVKLDELLDSAGAGQVGVGAGQPAPAKQPTEAAPAPPAGKPGASAPAPPTPPSPQPPATQPANP